VIIDVGPRRARTSRLPGTSEETVLLYDSTGGRPKACRMLTDNDETAAKLARLFGIEAYAPMS
jgi:hypothetical protein